MLTAAPRITVIGTGYLGAVHAAAMASLGYDTLGLDVDQERIDGLNAGLPPFYEPKFPQMLEAGLASGLLRFTTSYAEAAAHGDIHFICVGTPQKADAQGADLGAVQGCVSQLAPLLTRPCVVAGKSTVPVGTAEWIQAQLLLLAPAGEEVGLAWNPEFLREGWAVEDSLNPDRIVIGTNNARALAQLELVYSSMIDRGTPVIVTDIATAQLVKAAANAFLATKISFINAMADMCDAVGADVSSLAEAIGHDNRIGHRFLRAGLGFGGGCLPKDIRALMARAGELGLGETMGFLRELDEINLDRRRRVVQLAKTMCHVPLDRATFACLGAAFKPNSDDVRDSPALEVAAQLHTTGARVKVFDPHAMATAAARYPRLEYVASAENAMRDSNVTLLLTEWSEFIELDPLKAGTWVADQRIIDGRNVLDLPAWREAGWTVEALGRP